MSLLAVVPVLVHYKVIIVLYLLDPQDFGFLDPDPQKNVYSQNPNLNYWKKRDHKNFLISEWFIKF